jgi:hypothetical protein
MKDLARLEALKNLHNESLVSANILEDMAVHYHINGNEHLAMFNQEKAEHYKQEITKYRKLFDEELETIKNQNWE